MRNSWVVYSSKPTVAGYIKILIYNRIFDRTARTTNTKSGGEANKPLVRFCDCLCF